MELSPLPVMLLLVSLTPVAHAQAKPKPTVRVNPQSSVYTGDTITLSCELQQSTGWEFLWYKNSQLVNTVAKETNTLSMTVDDAGETVYQCTAHRYNVGAGTYYYTERSNQVTITARAKPKPTVRVNPQSSIYTGDTITLSCELQQSTGWKFLWYKNNQLVNTVARDTNTLSMTVDDAGETVYQCIALWHNVGAGTYYYTEFSDQVRITARERPRAVLSVSPQSWLTEGDSVTLSCEVTDSSTDWTFSWYTTVPYRDGLTQIKYNHSYSMYVELLSDSSRGSGGSYTLSPAALNHTGVYMCRGERGEPAFHTQYSNPQPLWITGKIVSELFVQRNDDCTCFLAGESPPVSLIINPSRTQHFTKDALSLSCEDQNGDVILESPVHPVTEGHPLTLRCLYRNTKPSNLRADFYKDGSVLQTQTTGEMIIRTVSKSDEGFYHCKHPERGESLKSWLSVRCEKPCENFFFI
ncbi:leukocyte immunoglobulin-like receptor subfamily B member 1 [Pangasianodon hypophthalmus]|uniref:leukocyte immunoglobulin-like receptor subfamily B member 1 n=1 Tax=Pangasianodon hypophthalmus TaxID=310915 RepID=UPI002307D1A2|nr:leukocyte immunoglobulin-like receptor subfamily B member 1 [Pangasianodon hypophthalmus]